MSTYTVGIDVGTTNVKAALVAADGRTVARASCPLVTRSPAGGGTEQDPAEVWDAVRRAVSAVTPAAGAPERIVALLCASQYSSIVPIGPDGREVGPLLLYRDGRGGEHTLAIYGRHPDAFELWLDRHGIPPLADGMDSLAHILHVQHDRPDVYAATQSFLEPMDFVNLRLTGRVAANQCTMFMSQLCDNRDLGVTAYDDDLLTRSGVDVEKLPELLPIDGVVGTVLPDVAAELGLAPSTKVYGGINDTHAAALATGAYGDRRGGVVIGTTNVMVDAVDFKHTDAEHEVLSMPGPLPDRYVVMAENGIGGAALDHLLREVVYASDALGDHTTDDPFRALDAVVGSVPPGSGGVLFLPWLMGSLAPAANPLMRGAFLNLSLSVGRAHLVRAVVEGLSLNLRWLLPVVEDFSGRRMEEVVFGGGAAASGEWAQVMADALDRPVRPLDEPGYGGSRAAALLALHREGCLPVDELIASVAAGPVREPRAEHRGTYDRMFDAFVMSHEQTRPIYEALNG